MHFSLRVWFVCVLIASWILTLALGFYLATPDPWWQVGVGMVAGIPAAMLRREHLTVAADALIGTRNLRDVSLVSASSSAGRLHGLLFCVAAVVLGLSVLLTHKRRADAALAFLSGMGAFWIASDVLSLRQLAQLNSRPATRRRMNSAR